MQRQKLFTVLIIVTLVAPLTMSCGLIRRTLAPTETPEIEEPSETPTEEAEPTKETEPTEEPEPTPTRAPLTYDVSIYGDLEILDPSNQMVTFWHQHSGPREELMLSMIDEFNRTNEWGITVHGEYQGDYDELHQEIIAGIPTGQVPSIAAVHQDRPAIYAALDALVALDPYVDSPTWGYTKDKLNDFFPIALTANILPQFDEALYSWPSYKSMEVLYYNEDWLAEMGYTGPPTTWEQFAEMACSAAQRPFSGATGEGQSYGYVYSISASRFATFVFSRGGNIINENGTGYVFNSLEGYEALTFMKDLVNQGCAAEQTERYGDQNDFGTGRSLFTIGPISDLPFYESTVDNGAGFNWSVNPPPHSTTEPRLNIQGFSTSLFKSSPEEQLAAWLFLKWLSEPEQQKTWISSTGYLPTRQSTTELLTDYFADHPSYEKALSFMSMDYNTEPRVVGYSRCNSAIADMLSAVLGSEDPQAQLDVTVEQCNEYLEASP